MKFIGSFLLGQLANLVGGTIEDGFLRLFVYNGYLYTKVGSDDAKMIMTQSEFMLLIDQMALLTPTESNVIDVSGTTELDCAKLFISNFIINEKTATYSSLSITNFNTDTGTSGVIYIKAPNSSYRLKIPDYTAGQLLLSDDV